jgi:hypothetical protein
LSKQSEPRWPEDGLEAIAVTKTSLMLCASLALAGCASSAAVSQPAPNGPANVVTFWGPTLGAEKQELYPNQCQSGGRHAFEGADVFDDRTKEVLVLRFVMDPLEGPVVRLFKDSDTGPSVVFRKADCTTFTYEFGGTGNNVNFVDEVKIALQLDCRGSQGDSVVGNVELPACL